MASKDVESGWKSWLKPGRLVPILTTLGAVLAITLSRLGIVQLSVSDNIIIALLALLAIDALTERFAFLERMEEKLVARLERMEEKLAVHSQQVLRRRHKLPSIEEQAGEASEICIISPAMSTLITYPSFFEGKLRQNCRMQILLLDPDDQRAVETWSYVVSKSATTRHKIEDTLNTLRGIVESSEARDRCEVRFSRIFVPFSMFAADLHSDSGSMVVEYHGYRVADDKRPCIFLRRAEDTFWFDEYREQFDKAWQEGTPWNPEAA